MNKFSVDANQLVVNVDVETVKDFLLDYLSKPQNSKEAVNFVLDIDSKYCNYKFGSEVFIKLAKQFFRDAESDGVEFDEPLLYELQEAYQHNKDVL